jgi:taurine dioxygenase
MANEKISVTRMSGALGAELSGVDLAEPLTADTIEEIRNALYEFGVIVLRDQDITPDQYLTFARNFGDILPYPMVQGLPDHPDIVPVLKKEDENVNFGGLWHTDTAYLEKPPMGSMLLALELPPKGGDTIWSNMMMAYETLSEGMKRMLDGLVAINSATKGSAAATREDRRKDAAKDDSGLKTTAEHPVVRTHPVTGKKSLYVNFGHTTHFKGMTEAESAPILNYLFKHQTRPEFTCQLHWEVGTLAFWENRITQHNPINDYHGHRRLLYRITLAGEKPF